MPSSCSLPPRLRRRVFSALGPSVLGSASLLLVLPLAQIIQAEPLPPGVIVDPVAVQPPNLVDAPEEPPDEPVEDPDVPDLVEPESFPDPFILDVVPGIDVGKYADCGPFTGFDEAAWKEEIVAWADLTVHPRALVQAQPVYPLELKRVGTEGTVRVQYLIRADGSVGSIQIVSASHPLFAEATERAVRRWRFQPGEKSGKPVACRVIQTLPFRIN